MKTRCANASQPATVSQSPRDFGRATVGPALKVMMGRARSVPLAGDAEPVAGFGRRCLERPLSLLRWAKAL